MHCNIDSHVELLLLVEPVSDCMLQVCGHSEHHKLMGLDDGAQQVGRASDPPNLHGKQHQVIR